MGQYSETWTGMAWKYLFNLYGKALHVILSSNKYIKLDVHI